MRFAQVFSLVFTSFALIPAVNGQSQDLYPRTATFPELQLSTPPSGTKPLSEITLTQGSAGAMAESPQGAAGGAEGAGQQDNGTNPAKASTTFSATNEFYNLKGGDRINTTYARFKFPWLGGKGAFSLEIPFAYYDFKSSFPNVPQIGALGDVRVSASYNTWKSEDNKLTVLNLFEAYLPTADNVLLSRPLPENALTAFNLGTGKYVLGAGIGFVYAFAPNFIFAPIYFFEASAFGNSDRPDIRRGKFRVFTMYAWENGVYMLPEFQAVTDYRSGSSDFYVAPEVGYNHKRTTFYIKPGIGIAPQQGDRAWGLEAGVRVQF